MSLCYTLVKTRPGGSDNGNRLRFPIHGSRAEIAMTAPLETEIKLVASPAMMAILRDHPVLAGKDRTATLEATYFDTIGGRLGGSGASLRIRTKGTEKEQTFKIGGAAGGAIRRSEWNVPASGESPDALLFPPLAQRALKRLTDGLAIMPIASVTVERTSRRIKAGRSSIEIAFDQGEIRAEGRTSRFCEVELELVKGRLADVLTLVSKLPLGPELAWSTRSKADRCRGLAFDQQPQSEGAERIVLGRSMNMAEGFGAIAWACLEHLLANYPLVVDGGHTGAVHQCRVAVRRLRAAFSLFKTVVGDDALPVIGAELKSVAGVLGAVRDLDVLLARVSGGSGEEGCEELTELQQHLSAGRAVAVAAAGEAVSSPRFQQLLFELALWIEAGAWRSSPLLNQPLAPFAAEILNRRRRMLLRAGRKLRNLSDGKRHRLRIAAKKLRYAAEFFAALFTAGRGRREYKAFHASLVRLQDSLGELNDQSVATANRSVMFTDNDPILAARLEALMDVLLVPQTRSAKKLLKRSERALEQLGAANAWWKPRKANAGR